MMFTRALTLVLSAASYSGQSEALIRTGRFGQRRQVSKSASTKGPFLKPRPTSFRPTTITGPCPPSVPTPPLPTPPLTENEEAIEEAIQREIAELTNMQESKKRQLRLKQYMPTEEARKAVEGELGQVEEALRLLKKVSEKQLEQKSIFNTEDEDAIQLKIAKLTEAQEKVKKHINYSSEPKREMLELRKIEEKLKVWKKVSEKHLEQKSISNEINQGSKTEVEEEIQRRIVELTKIQEHTKEQISSSKGERKGLKKQLGQVEKELEMLKLELKSISNTEEEKIQRQIVELTKIQEHLEKEGLKIQLGRVNKHLEMLKLELKSISNGTFE